MLMLQLKHEEMIKKAEAEKQLMVEKLHFEMEQAKLNLQQYRLDLIKSGKLATNRLVGLESTLVCPDKVAEGVTYALQKFNERDPESFFSLFELVRSVRMLMLQCALTGRAEEAYSALSFTNSQSYELVKSAVLKSYELVPEAYQQRLRSWRKAEKQAPLAFAQDLVAHFMHWCSSLNVNSFHDLCDLIVLEQFKNPIPEGIATHIAEQKVKTAI